jgi:hypothetical protein
MLIPLPLDYTNHAMMLPLLIYRYHHLYLLLQLQQLPFADHTTTQLPIDDIDEEWCTVHFVRDDLFTDHGVHINKLVQTTNNEQSEGTQRIHHNPEHDEIHNHPRCDCICFD